MARPVEIRYMKDDGTIAIKENVAFINKWKVKDILFADEYCVVFNGLYDKGKRMGLFWFKEAVNNNKSGFPNSRGYSSPLVVPESGWIRDIIKAGLEEPPAEKYKKALEDYKKNIKREKR